jgi:hypothetical protein
VLLVVVPEDGSTDYTDYCDSTSTTLA